MAVVTVAIRNRTSIAVLRVRETENGDVIVLQTMMWPDEVRTPDFSVDVDDLGEIKDSEVKMAQMLVETLAGDFDASDFSDDYAEAVEAVVKAKIEGGEVQRTETSTKGSGEVVDLLAALQRSVQAAKKSRGEDVDEADTPADDAGDADAEEKPAPRKRASKKTAPAKKSATTKTAAKKTTATKSTSRKTTSRKTASRKTASRKTAAKKAS